MKSKSTYFSLVLILGVVLSNFNAVAQNKDSYAIMPVIAVFTLKECLYSETDLTFSPCSWPSKFQRPNTRNDLNDTFQSMFFSAYEQYPALREFQPTSYTYDEMDDLQIRSERELFDRLLIELDYKEYRGRSISRKYAHRWAPLIHNITKGDIPDYLVYVVGHGSANLLISDSPQTSVRGDLYIHTIIIDTKNMNILPVITTSSTTINTSRDKKITKKRLTKILKRNQKKHEMFYLKEQKKKQKGS